jgi:hypothetical protein
MGRGERLIPGPGIQTSGFPTLFASKRLNPPCSGLAALAADARR